MRRPQSSRMRAGLAAFVACGVLVGCQAGAAPLTPPTVVSAPAPPTPESPTAIPTPTLVAPTPTATPRPPLGPTLTSTPVPSPTPPQPTRTPDPLRAVQQHFCDTASPPARLPLPPNGSLVHIPRAGVVK